jgi:hypothetical protein
MYLLRNFIEKYILMSFFKLATLVIILFSSQFSFSQEQIIKKTKYDTLYIISYSNLLTTKATFIIRGNNFNIYDKTSKRSLKYKPNESLAMGFAGYHKKVGLELAFNLPFINNDNDKYGKTYQRDLHASRYGRKTIIDLNLQSYKGFYIENAKELNPSWNSKFDPYPKRPDISTLALGGSFYYILNSSRFSYRAAFIQDEAQKQRAGSLLLGGYLNFFNLQSDSSIIPKQLQSAFNDRALLIKGKTLTFGAGVGYAYTIVIRKHFFITLSAIPGIALVNFEGQKENMDYFYSKTKIALRSQIRFATGYNGGKFYAGLNLTTDNISMDNSEQSSINYHLGNIRFYAGRRFDLSKIISKF